MTAAPRITTCLWFDFKAEEAVAFYLSVFTRAKMTATARYGEHGPGPVGAVMTIAFEIEGQPFLALNGGPQFPFTPAVSLIVNCDDQAEIDRYWARLSEGGKTGRCGWLTDRFGLSWQIVPRDVARWMTGPEKNAARVMQAVLRMDKLDIAELEKAYEPTEEASHG